MAMMEKGRAIHSPLFTIRILDQKTAKATKVAAVAPQKVAKTAVKRNNTRRKIYQAIERLVPSLKKGFFIGIFAKSPALTAETAKIGDDLKDLFVKAKVLS